MARLHWMDGVDLACALLGLPDSDDVGMIEEALADRFEISLEAFGALVEALIPFTIPAKSATSGEMFQGFVKDGAFIVRAPVSGAQKKSARS